MGACRLLIYLNLKGKLPEKLPRKMHGDFTTRLELALSEPFLVDEVGDKVIHIYTKTAHTMYR